VISSIRQLHRSIAAAGFSASQAMIARMGVPIR